MRIFQSAAKWVSLSPMSDSLPEATCGDCIAFIKQTDDEAVRGRGPCKLRPEMGMISGTLTACGMLKLRISRQGKVRITEGPPKSRRGMSRQSAPERPRRPARPTMKNPTLGDSSGTLGDLDMDRDGLKQVLRELLEEETLYGYPEMASRWQEGTLVMKPADPANQPKEVPIESFFHKIVMLRDRLRVLEAKLNGQDKLSEQDKVELQGYVSKCYGTLTTFNVLFADKADQFRSK